jgi:translation initiation factor 5B
MGHVDHGKSTILDRIRGTKVVSREAGGITQHIGATDVPIETIYELCRPLIGERKFLVPGLLFIDTPGHYSFATLRARGGALADLAVLVIDVNEGIKPQTLESITILRKFKTPFVIAANKVDRLMGWRVHPGMTVHQSLKEQDPRVVSDLDERIYSIAGSVFERTGFSADRFDHITDFTKSIAIVPTSGKHGEGIPDLLLVLVGLAQKFLEEELVTEEGPAEGTVLEVKEDKGIGTVLDTIIYKGSLSVGDQILVSSVRGDPLQAKVRALLRPRPLDEIRDPSQRFDQVKSVTAAAGIRIVAQGLEDAMAGGILRVANENVDQIMDEVKSESELKVDLADEGIIVRGDAIGSLEALVFEAKNAELPIRKVGIGKVTRKDVLEASNFENPLHRVIFAFNTELNPDVEDELSSTGVKMFRNNVIYRLLEEYGQWCEVRSRELEAEKRLEIVFPGRVKILRDHIFRVSKPAIVGVRILAGRIRPGQALMREDGRSIGRIKSIRSGESTKAEAIAGSEVAIAIDDVTVGRQIDVEDVLLVDIPESHARELYGYGLSVDELEVLEQVAKIKRKEKPFWGK